MVSRKTKKRIEGLEQLGTVGLSQIPPLDKLNDANEAYKGFYKALKGRDPPPLKRLLSFGERMDREERRKERAFDRRIERMGR